MEEAEFRRLLNLFPVVRSRLYCADDESSSAMIRREDERDEVKEFETMVTQWQDAWSEADKKKKDLEVDIHDPFWEKLRPAAERKVTSAEAQNFCIAFQKLHKKIVYETLSLDAAQRILGTSGRLIG